MPDFTVGVWGFQGPTYRERFAMEGSLTPGINVGYAVVDMGTGGDLVTLPPGADFPAGIVFGLLGGHLWLPGPITFGTPEFNRATRWAATFGPDSYKRLDA